MAVVDFAKQLKEGTKTSHTAAENTKFVKGFLKGCVDKDSYGQLIANFYFIYHALESEVDRLKEEDQVIAQIAFDDLKRHDALAEDCKYYWGDTWQDKIRPTVETQKYVDRIREVAHKDPYLLVGHHYTRYIGDLSGGQILKGIAERALNIQVGDGGLDFYEFPTISDKKSFKTKYRATLDALPIDESQANAIVTEANYAFRLNMFMFDEIQGNAGKSFLQLLNSYFQDFVREMTVSARYR